MRSLLAISLLAAECASLDVPTVAEQQCSTAEGMFELGARRYRVLHPGHAAPAVYAYHPGNWDATMTAYDSLADDFIVIYLEADGAYWELDPAGPDLSYVEDVLDAVESTYCTTGTFFVGNSSGSMAAQAFGCRIGVDGVFAGAGTAYLPDAPIVHQLGLTPTPLPAACAAAVPVMTHHGGQDPVVPVAWEHDARDMWIVANGCDPVPTTYVDSLCDGRSNCICEQYECTGAPLVYCEDDGGHGWWPEHQSRAAVWFGGIQ